MYNILRNVTLPSITKLTLNQYDGVSYFIIIKVVNTFLPISYFEQKSYDQSKLLRTNLL